MPDTGTVEASATEATPEGGDLGDAGKRALEKERNARREAERRLKELEPLAERARELEEGQKSQAEKLTEKARTLEARAAQAELEVARYRVALRHGLTESQARRLVGASEDELDADAQAYLEEVGGAAPATETGNGNLVPPRPRETLKPGAMNNVNIGDDDALLRSVKEKLGI